MNKNFYLKVPTVNFSSWHFFTITCFPRSLFNCIFSFFHVYIFFWATTKLKWLSRGRCIYSLQVFYKINTLKKKSKKVSLWRTSELSCGKNVTCKRGEKTFAILFVSLQCVYLCFPHWWTGLELVWRNSYWYGNLFYTNFLLKFIFFIFLVFDFHQAADGIQEQQRQEQAGKK